MEWDFYKVGGQFGSNNSANFADPDGRYSENSSTPQLQNDGTNAPPPHRRSMQSNSHQSHFGNPITGPGPYYVQRNPNIRQFGSTQQAKNNRQNINTYQNTNTQSGSPRRTYADVLQTSPRPPIPARYPVRPPTSALGNVPYRRRQPEAEIQAANYRPEHRGHVENVTRKRTYADAVRGTPSPPSGPANRQGPNTIIGGSNEGPTAQVLMSDAELNALFGLDSNGQAAQAYDNPVWDPPPGTLSRLDFQGHVPGGDITRNVNWQTGISEGSQSVGQWVAQPRTLGDRTRQPPLQSRTPQFRPPHSRQISQQSSSNMQSWPSFSSQTSSQTSSRRNRAALTTGIYEFRCETCRAGFDTSPDLNHHMRYHTSYEERAHSCTVCRKLFQFAKDLRRHERVHREAEFFCPFDDCKYAADGFKREDHLERHLRIKHAVDSARQVSQPPSPHGSWA